jgi:DTW domain-containing protein
MISAQDTSLADVIRERCYDCYRPASDCFCDVIPAIENQTSVLILQHMRERAHPFNTARIVHLALQNSSLLVDHTKDLAATLASQSGALQPGAGLLYPGPDAALLDDLPVGQRPAQLVVLDGTWHHAKTLLRDIPALHPLPRYKLAPVSPSRYRIRREPSAAYLSTVEATVAALRVLEPETRGWDQLLAAFDCMVERQLAHPRFIDARRRHLPRESGWRR